MAPAFGFDDRDLPPFDDGVLLPLPPSPAAATAAGDVAAFVRGLDWTNVQGPVRDALLALAEASQSGGAPGSSSSAAASGAASASALQLKVEWLSSAVADLQRRVRWDGGLTRVGWGGIDSIDGVGRFGFGSGA